MAVIGPKVTSMVGSDGKVSIGIDTTATVYTHSESINFGQYFAVALQATSSAGTVDVVITIEQSWKRPATEGSSDTDWVLPNGLSDVVTNRTDETVYIASISPIAAPYIRFKIVGENSNNADTKLWMRLMRQEEI